jgi:hypothetical protein
MFLGLNLSLDTNCYSMYATVCYYRLVLLISLAVWYFYRSYIFYMANNDSILSIKEYSF